MSVLVTASDVRRHALGIGDYLDEYNTDEDAQDASLIDPLIDEAEAAFERVLRILLKTTRVKAKPADSDVLGTDYDLEGGVYHYYHDQWKGTPRFVLRHRPVQEVTLCNLAFPSGSTVLTIPTSWFSVRKQHGVLSIVPSGADAAITVGAAQIWLPIVASSYRGMIPDFVQIDYTAGYADDPITEAASVTGNRDVREIREAVARAVAGCLIRQAQVVAAMRGQISMDGLSESFGGADFETAIKGFEEAAKAFRRSFEHTRTPPRMVTI